MNPEDHLCLFEKRQGTLHQRGTKQQTLSTRFMQISSNHSLTFVAMAMVYFQSPQYATCVAIKMKLIEKLMHGATALVDLSARWSSNTVPHSCVNGLTSHHIMKIDDTSNECNLSIHICDTSRSCAASIVDCGPQVRPGVRKRRTHQHREALFRTVPPLLRILYPRGKRWIVNIKFLLRNKAISLDVCIKCSIMWYNASNESCENSWYRIGGG